MVTHVLRTEPWRPPQQPLVAVLAFFVLGIVLDRALQPWETPVAARLALGSVAGFALAGFAFETRWLRLPLLLLAVTATGAGWHHNRWFDLAPDDLARFRLDRPAPAWLRGTLSEVPEYLPAEPGWITREGLTRMRLAVTARHDGHAWRPASGGVLVLVTGNCTHLRMGRPVEAAGTIEEIKGPRNPGESDARERWRADGIRLTLHVEITNGVSPDPYGRPEPALVLLGEARLRSQQQLVRSLDADAAPIAAALLLGRREQVDPDTSDAFVRTGTIHLLAISGLHMQALAFLLGILLMFCGLGPKHRSIAVAVAVIAYTVLVGARPSVVRAATMSVVFCLATLCNRQRVPATTLALAGLVTLGINPSSLFDPGCQLSFLCVAALFWCVPPAARLFGLSIPDGMSDFMSSEPDVETPREALDRLQRMLRPRWRRWLDRIGRVVALSLVGSAVLTVVNMPITTQRFHLFSPVGILLNVPLVALSVPALGLTVLALGASLIGGFLGAWGAWACSKLMHLTVWLVHLGGRWRLGYVYTASPPGWWVVGFYVVLALLCWSHLSRRGLAAKIALGALLACWSCWGAAYVVLPHPPAQPAAEVFAVDHGLCVLVQSPSGKTLLYDCGRMHDSHIGRRVIAPALWERGVRRIDVVVLSHADADHYSGFAELLERFVVGRLCVPPGFGGLENPGADELLRRAREHGVSCYELTAGDTVELGPRFHADVLHPPRDFSTGEPDNARSIVLDISHGGHHLLLTGDLEGSGMSRLLNERPRRVDILLAPHHGGRTANPAALFAWSEPRLVVASQKRPQPGTHDALAPLEGIPVLRTWQAGAVRLCWRDGTIDIATHEKELASRLQQVQWIRGHPSLLARLDVRRIPWLGVLLIVVGVLAGAAIALALMIVEWGAWLLVAPGRRDASDNSGAPVTGDWSEVEVRAEDGAVLRGRLWLAQEDRAPVVIVLHGFAETSAAVADRALAVAAEGLSVLVIDLRGRGLSDGAFCTFGALESDDLVHWVNLLTQRLGADIKIALWGRSMGAAIALRAAAEDSRIGALILEAPYASLEASVRGGLRRRRLPGWLARPILARAESIIGRSLRRPRQPFVATAIKVPTLVLVGSNDVVAPLAQIEPLLCAFRARPKLIEIAGAGHADIYDLASPDEKSRIMQFVRSALEASTR